MITNGCSVTPSNISMIGAVSNVHWFKIRVKIKKNKSVVNINKSSSYMNNAIANTEIKSKFIENKPIIEKNNKKTQKKKTNLSNIDKNLLWDIFDSDKKILDEEKK